MPSTFFEEHLKVANTLSSPVRPMLAVLLYRECLQSKSLASQFYFQ